MFGMYYFPDEGLMNHSLHTAIIDRRGRLVANIEGNQFTPDQLCDLVQNAQTRPGRRRIRARNVAYSSLSSDPVQGSLSVTCRSLCQIVDARRKVSRLALHSQGLHSVDS